MRSVWTSGCAVSLVYFSVFAPHTVAQEGASAGASAAAASANAFAVDLYEQLRGGEQGNLFFAPYSVANVLAMAWAGAEGETARELARALHLSTDAAATHRAFEALNRALEPAGQAVQDEAPPPRRGREQNRARSRAAAPEYTLHIANALWGQQDYAFLPEYLHRVQTHYGGTLGSLDFAQRGAHARKTVNDWAAEKTHGRIQNLLAAPPHPDTRLLLANAVYFKADWRSPFERRETQQQDFHLLGGGSVKVPMMRQTTHLDYMQLDGVSAVTLPYRGERMEMLILLPDEREGLPALEARLSTAFLKELEASRRSTQVQLAMPRFTMTREVPLNSALQGLGITTAFEEGAADFSGMDGTRELFLGPALQSTLVEVNEEGTVAVAATRIMGGITSTAIRRFNVEHPYLFAIRHTETQAILFLGRVMNPA